jgi:hypothetical protein
MISAFAISHQNAAHEAFILGQIREGLAGWNLHASSVSTRSVPCIDRCDQPTICHCIARRDSATLGLFLVELRMVARTLSRWCLAVGCAPVVGREILDQNKSDAENIQKRLDKLAGGNLSAERRRREVYSDLHKLFDRGVGAYREQLRRRVEADATKHFKALTTEPDYASLRINDSYGQYCS